ncbi:unnamed protein product [Acanthoscelides obtectus]|uniref:Uncharacterized protein n=1 Tax=Acanthoscelides obtectus TaxID=200917 RepID=A0A9P0Q9X5_ACAOB|nr:unnamed protein product [Acanthoscelides obtectus]CAK1657164.1 hypothetical protein AOBTE_LOCUS20168 [Acanthoscelides obtectus]
MQADNDRESPGVKYVPRNGRLPRLKILSSSDFSAVNEVIMEGVLSTATSIFFKEEQKCVKHFTVCLNVQPLKELVFVVVSIHRLQESRQPLMPFPLPACGINGDVMNNASRRFGLATRLHRTVKLRCSEYILISTEGNSAIQSQWQSQNAEVSYKWTRQNTLLFLDLYKKYKQLLMAGKIKLKKLYESIANEINHRTNENVAPSNCENR